MGSCARHGNIGGASPGHGGCSQLLPETCSSGAKTCTWGGSPHGRREKGAGVERLGPWAAGSEELWENEGEGGAFEGGRRAELLGLGRRSTGLWQVGLVLGRGVRGRGGHVCVGRAWAAAFSCTF